MTIDTSSIEYLNREAEAARACGDYETYWRLRQQYLNEQARLYAQAQRQQQRTRRER